MLLRLRSGFGICFLLFAASAQQPGETLTVVPPLTQPVIKSKAVAEFCKRFHQAKSLSFSAYFSLNTSQEFGLMTMNWYAVQAKRPNRFAIRGGPTFKYEPEDKDGKHVTFIGGGDNICISEGKTLLLVNPFLHSYQLAPAPASLTQVNTEAFHSINGSVVLNTDLLIGYIAAPDENLNILTPAVVFTRTEESEANAIHYVTRNKLYFDAKTGELLEYSQYVRRLDIGIEAEIQRVDYDNWKFNAKIPTFAFDTTPPRNARSSEELGKALKAAMDARH